MATRTRAPEESADSRLAETYAAVTVFLLVLTCSVPEVAAVLAFIVAGGMVGAGVVLYAREGKR